jgi:hypothetical protein
MVYPFETNRGGKNVELNHLGQFELPEVFENSKKLWVSQGLNDGLLNKL